MKSNYKLIKQLLKENKISQAEVEKIITSYSKYGISKNAARKLINVYEKMLMKNTGILERDTTTDIKKKMMTDYNLEDIIINNKENENIDQNLKIGDLVYTFRIKDKLSKLK